MSQRLSEKSCIDVNGRLVRIHLIVELIGNRAMSSRDKGEINTDPSSALWFPLFLHLWKTIKLLRAKNTNTCFQTDELQLTTPHGVSLACVFVCVCVSCMPAVCVVCLLCVCVSAHDRVYVCARLTSQWLKTSCGLANPLVLLRISSANPKLSATGRTALMMNISVPSFISSCNTRPSLFPRTPYTRPGHTHTHTR